MFKILPATEKEFDMAKVDEATPGWLKFVMLIFVAIFMLSLAVI